MWDGLASTSQLLTAFWRDDSGSGFCGVATGTPVPSKHRGLRARARLIASGVLLLEHAPPQKRISVEVLLLKCSPLFRALTGNVAAAVLLLEHSFFSEHHAQFSSRMCVHGLRAVHGSEQVRELLYTRERARIFSSKRLRMTNNHADTQRQ